MLNVTGTATLGGSVQVVAEAGSYASSGQYTIIEATSVSGAFNSTVTGNLPGYTFTLSQDSNSVFLLYSFTGFPSSVAIGTSGLSGNVLSLANYLNTNGSSSALAPLNGLSGGELQEALVSISPARNAFGTYIAAQTAFSFSGLVSNHMDAFRGSETRGTRDSFLSLLTADSSGKIAAPRSGDRKNILVGWASGFGEFAYQSASSQNPAFHFNSGGLIAGLDYQGKSRSLVGGSLGYAHTGYHESDHAGSGDINYYFASIYGNRFFNNFYISPAISGIYNKTKNKRNISFMGFLEKARADIFAWQLLPHLEIGYDQVLSFGHLIPFTSLDWAISWQRGYKEHGASPYNATQGAHSSSMARSETGLRLSERWEKSWGALLLNEKFSYVFEKPFGVGKTNAAFIGLPGTFNVTAVNQNLNLGAIGLNCLFMIGKAAPMNVDLGYEGEFGSNYWSNQFMLKLSKSF
ncbi:MAG: autotransporter outer membrane beta-barrel domain-containing protein [Rhabdochlamydiaceae bacterium]